MLCKNVIPIYYGDRVFVTILFAFIGSAVFHYFLPDILLYKQIVIPTLIGTIAGIIIIICRDRHEIICPILPIKRLKIVISDIITLFIIIIGIGLIIASPTLILKPKFELSHLLIIEIIDLIWLTLFIQCYLYKNKIYMDRVIEFLKEKLNLIDLLVRR
jgi:hypothetical protein